MSSLASLSTAHHTDNQFTASSWLQAFLNKADFYRFGWAAAIALVQGCLLTPALLMSTFIYGGSDLRVLLAFLSFLGVLIPILSALAVQYVLSGFAMHVVLITWNLL